MKPFFEFSKEELQIFALLNTPGKIQDFINKIPINFEEDGDTYLSPREVLKQNRAHCVEGALLAATILWYHGQKPLLLDLTTTRNDQEHVVALFKKREYWGAISKTNHAVLRYREPVYKTVRELAMSYFHEYFLHSGQKTLRYYSDPIDVSKIKDRSWLTTTENLWELVHSMYDTPHHPILERWQVANLRPADPIEIQAGKLTQYKQEIKKQD